MWEVEFTDEFDEWWNELDEEAQERITAAVDLLIERGPALGRPTVGEIAGASVHNLKELRPHGTSLRILFAFDPRRTAILLIGGDKAKAGWKAWYPWAIAEAEKLYVDYLEELRKERIIE
jgi:hypothetical protein